MSEQGPESFNIRDYLREDMFPHFGRHTNTGVG